MTVSEGLWSCCGPSRLAHHGDLRSSQWNKPQKLHRPPFEWKNKSLLWHPFRYVSGRPHQSLQPSFMALSSRAIFKFRWIRLSFIHKTHALNTLFSACHVKKLACIYEPQFGWSSLNISLSDSVFSRWLLSKFWSVHLSNCHERQTFLNSSLISFLYCWRWKDVREKSGSL